MKRKKGQKQQPGSATTPTNSSSSKTKISQSDFKRLKAKVGKTAPKAANYTDTSFQTAGLKLRDQHLIGEIQQSSSLLSSSRGNSLESLLFQLDHHHAPAARISALKGIQNILVGNKIEGSESVIRSNLASLVPPLSKCAFLDTDPTVRSIGRDLLRIVFASANATRYSGNTDKSALLDPFLPLYVAYVSSAFNSLHDDIRQDVTHGVQLATEFFTSPFYCESTKHTAIYRLLPSFARLISTSSSSSIGGTNINTNSIKVSKKRRKNASKAKDKAISAASNTADAKFISLRCQILKSLKSFLQWSFTGTDENCNDAHKSIISNLNTVTDDTTDNPWIRMFERNSSLNALLIANEADTRNGRSSSTCNPINSVHDLFSCDDHNVGECYMISPSRTSSFIRPMLSVLEDTVTALLNSLINCWVEVIQRGIISASGGTILSCRYVEELSYIISCLQELWINILQHSPKFGYEKVARIQKHLLEAFPVKDDSGVSTNVPIYNRLNASICFLLSNIIGGTTAASSSTVTLKTTATLERIFAYMIPQLRDQQERITDIQEDTDSSAIMEVVTFLLLRHKNSGAYLLQPKERHTLLKEFVDTFFFITPSVCIITGNIIAGRMAALHDEFKTRYAQTYTTLVGRKVIVLACEVILGDSYLFAIPSDEDEHQQLDVTDSNILLLLRMTFALPHLLRVLGTKYLFESSVVIRALKLITQQWCCYIPSSVKMTYPEIDSNLTYTDYARYFLFRLRRDMALLLTGESRRCSKISFSIFERYPINMQRSIIGLIGFLESPDSDVTDALAQICTRILYFPSSKVDAESITSYIFETLFLIRKSVSLTSYLNFLISSCGIGLKYPLLSPPGPGHHFIFSYDFAAKYVGRAIVQSGCKFILPHLKKVLMSCLQHQRFQKENIGYKSMLSSLIKIRVSTMILSECSANLNRLVSTATSITSFLPEMVDAIGPLICDSLLPYLEILQLSKQDRGKIMSPFVCLLIHEPELTKAFVAEALDRLNEQTMSDISGTESQWSKRRLSKVEALYVWELISLNAEILNVNDDTSKDLVGKLSRSLNSL